MMYVLGYSKRGVTIHLQDIHKKGQEPKAGKKTRTGAKNSGGSTPNPKSPDTPKKRGSNWSQRAGLSPKRKARADTEARVTVRTRIANDQHESDESPNDQDQSPEVSRPML